MTNYTVEVLDVMVTEWSNEYQDWSGDEFSKQGFVLGNSKSNKLDDVLATINTMFDVEKEDVEINEEGQLIFTVIENGYAEQSLEGNFMVDYIVEVIESRNVEIVQ